MFLKTKTTAVLFEIDTRFRRRFRQTLPPSLRRFVVFVFKLVARTLWVAKNGFRPRAGHSDFVVAGRIASSYQW
ncbi:uncharacterized protein METZ01_LOCUS102236, partial [marine metagenome]